MIEPHVALKSIGLDAEVVALTTFQAAPCVLAIMTLPMLVQDTGIASGELAFATLQRLLARVLTHVNLERVLGSKKIVKCYLNSLLS